jgi:integrase
MLVIDIAQPGEKRKQYRRRFDTYKAARAELTRIRTERERGTYVAPQKLTLAQYVETWLPIVRTQVRASTAASYETSLRNRVLPALGARQIQSIRPADLTALYAALLATGRSDHRAGEPLSPRSVEYTATIVGKVFKSALRGGLVQVSPALAAEVPKSKAAGAATQTVMRTWSAEQLAAFLASVVEHRHAAAFHFLATTGARRGEVLGLGWSQVDLDAGWASVAPGRVLVDARRGQPVWSSPKTDRGRRRIALDAGTVAVLRTLRAGQAAEKLKLGSAYTDHDLVFCWEDGRPIEPNAFSKSFNVAVKRAGLPRIRVHDLRHTYCTLALQAGVDTKIVSDRVGHSTTAITSGIYQHVSPQMQSDVAERVAGLIFGSKSS